MQAGGRRFDPVILHHRAGERVGVYGCGARARVSPGVRACRFVSCEDAGGLGRAVVGHECNAEQDAKGVVIFACAVRWSWTEVLG